MASEYSKETLLSDIAGLIDPREDVIGHGPVADLRTVDPAVDVQVVEESVARAGVDRQQQVHDRDAGVVRHAEGRAVRADVERFRPKPGRADLEAVSSRRGARQTLVGDVDGQGGG